jgi:5-methylcytosine-specific restriction endonuclease McrA
MTGAGQVNAGRHLRRDHRCERPVRRASRFGERTAPLPSESTVAPPSSASTFNAVDTAKSSATAVNQTEQAESRRASLGPRIGSRCRICTSTRNRSNPYTTPAWRQLSLAVVRRDGACVQCGGTFMLAAHHVIPRAEGGPTRPRTSRRSAPVATPALRLNSAPPNRTAGKNFRCTNPEGRRRSRGSRYAALPSPPGGPPPLLHDGHDMPWVEDCHVRHPGRP